MLSSISKYLVRTTLALGLGLTLGLGGQSAEANTTCYVSDPTTTMAAIATSTIYGPMTAVSLQVANYTFGDPRLICNDSRVEGFFNNTYGAFVFNACGHNIYYGSWDGSHTVGDWAENCNAAFLLF